MPEQFLFIKEKGSLFNVKIWMKILVKKSTLCYGNLRLLYSLVHRFRNNYTTHLSANPIAQV